MTLHERYGSGEVSQPFWKGLEERRLMLPRCVACGTTFFFPRRWCPECWSSDIEWVEASGSGTVFAATKVHLPFQGIDEADLPITVVLVDLDEGPRLTGRVAAGSSPVAIGDAIRIAYADDPANELPTFVPGSA